MLLIKLYNEKNNLMNTKYFKINTTRNNFRFGSNSTSNIFYSTRRPNFEQFSNDIKRKMSYYNFDKDTGVKDFERTKLILNKTGIKIKSYEKDYIRQVTKRYSWKSEKPPKIDVSGEENETIVNLSISMPKDNFYISPIHSLSVLKINHKVHSNVLKLNLKRQKYIYDKSIEEFKNNRKKLFNRLAKLKITELNPINNNLFDFKPKENTHNLQKPINENLVIPNKPNKNLSIQLYTRLFACFKYSSKNYPESREQFSFVLCDENIYLIGGICCINETDEIWKYNTPSLSWSKIKINNKTLSRFGHTAILDKNKSKIYIFGGRSKLDIWSHSISNERKEYYGNTEYYDIKQNEWNLPIMKSKYHPTLRRNHTAELVGNELIIMLGISESNVILNDAYSLNLSFPEGKKEKWNEVHISKDTPGPRLFGHCSSLVVHKDILKEKKFSIYKFPEEDKIYRPNNFKDKIKLKGIYVFGGKSKSIGNGGISNDLYVLLIGNDPCSWHRIDNVKGMKPAPRYFHSMNFYEPGNFLIVHGGRNDYKSENYALNDTFILDLELFQWHRIMLIGIDKNSIVPRCGHQSVISGNQLFIFGGMNNSTYIGSSMFIVNLVPDTFHNFMTSNIDEENKLNDDDYNETKKPMKKKGPMKSRNTL